MRRGIVLAPVVLVAALGLASCGGGGSDAATTAPPPSVGSSGPSGPSPSSGGGGAGSSSDQAFCDSFQGAEAKLRPAAALPTKAELAELRATADMIEKTAPNELKEEAKTVADYLHFIANAAEKSPASTDLAAGKNLANMSVAVGKIGAWAATHCHA